MSNHGWAKIVMNFREHRWHITVTVTDMLTQELGVEKNTALYSDDLYRHLLWLDFSIPITGNNKQKT